MRPPERITKAPTDTGTQIDPERIVWALGIGLWATVLLGTIGYVLHSFAAALLGGLFGLFFAYQFYRHGPSKGTRAPGGGGAGTRRGDAIDWRRLLDYEKLHFAEQLERDGRLERAETIYRHLVNHDFPSLVPHRRLAAIYRQRGAYRTEIDILEQALARVRSKAAPPSADIASTRRELLQQREQAQKRLEKAPSPNSHDASA